MFISLGLFVLLQAPKKKLNQIFFLYSLSASIFYISHVIGINVADPELSRKIFMFNMSTILTSAFLAHWPLILVGRDIGRKYVFYLFYATAIVIIGFFLLNPTLFLILSEPKLYFINYYVLGKYYYLGDLFFYLSFTYFAYQVITGYVKANTILRRRVRYISIGLISTYILSTLPALPLYGINIDPLFSAFAGLAYIPVVYGVIKEDLLDVHVIAKQALLYTLAVLGTGLVLVFGGYVNDQIVRATHANRFIVPTMVSLGLVILARLIWVRLAQTESLKYAFVKVILHKYRTPLTYIKWSVNDLENSPSEEVRKVAIMRIKSAYQKISELTELVSRSNDLEGSTAHYVFQNVNYSALIEESVESERGSYEDKDLSVSLEIEKDLNTSLDLEKFRLAVNVIITNAITYTHNRGRILVSVKKGLGSIVLTVTDNGMGIAPKDLQKLFHKFYRAEKASNLDTEGLGISLFMAKKIIEAHGGKIEINSKGPMLGTTVIVTVPLKTI